jgi:hypothetical protein
MRQQINQQVRVIRSSAFTLMIKQILQLRLKNNKKSQRQATKRRFRNREKPNRQIHQPILQYQHLNVCRTRTNTILYRLY